MKRCDLFEKVCLNRTLYIFLNMWKNISRRVADRVCRVTNNTPFCGMGLVAVCVFFFFSVSSFMIKEGFLL